MKKIICILFVFSFSLYADEYIFYVRKIEWHTGIVIQNDSLAKNQISAVKNLPSLKYLEFGMGDEEYYQAKDPSYFDAVKAAAVSSPAAIRIHSKSISPEKLAGYSDFMYKIIVSQKEYIKLLNYIDTSIKENNGKNDILSTKHNNTIIFVKSTENYHLFNTCNTWIANALVKINVIKKSSIVIQANDLERLLKRSEAKKID